MKNKTNLNNRLLAEFFGVVDAEILSFDEVKKNTELFGSIYPLTPWGKIDWSAIEIKEEINCIEEIIPILHAILMKPIDPEVYILCDDAMMPRIKANLGDIITHFLELQRISMHKFIFNTKQGYIIEVLFSGDVTIGLINKDRIVLCGHLEKFLNALTIEKFYYKYDENFMRMLRKMLNPFVQPRYWNIGEPCLLNSVETIIPTIEKFLKLPIQKDIILIWNDKQFPIIQTSLEKVILLWTLLLEIKMPFQMIAINSSYLIDVCSADIIKVTVNSGLKSH